jgi:biotin carboxyl carrier protein
MAREQVTEILAEMVANVMAIEVAPGDAVAVGQTVCLLESMKMEIPVIAEDGGTLRELRVEEGKPVAEGQVVAVLEA